MSHTQLAIEENLSRVDRLQMRVGLRNVRFANGNIRSSELGAGRQEIGVTNTRKPNE